MTPGCIHALQNYQRLSRLLLVGDHLQLQATAISPAAARSGYKRSLMERLTALKHPNRLLNEQFRCAALMLYEFVAEALTSCKAQGLLAKGHGHCTLRHL